jgi:hypothetical protein
MPNMNTVARLGNLTGPTSPLRKQLLPFPAAQPYVSS